MSRLKLISKYIFFLFLGISIPNFLLSQSIKPIKSSPDKLSQNIGEILFISNINGVIENCSCGNPPLGGMPQIATIIGQENKKNKYSYFFDGGDFMNTYPYPILNSAMIEIYKTINPTFLALGDQEWIDSDSMDQSVLSELADKIIATNYKVDNKKFKKIGWIALRDGTKAGILTYLDERSFYVSDDKKNIQFDNENFNSIYNNISSKTGLIVLIFHGTKYTLDILKQDYPKIKLILWAHEQSELEDIQSHPAIVGGGSDGEHIRQINIFKQGNNYHFIINSIPVSADISKDPQIESIVEKFRIADKLEKNGD